MTNPANPIDELMERASRTLYETRYFDAAALCVEGLMQARASDDFARMARICLPLQEARRWIRQTALDTGAVRMIARASDLTDPFEPGCYLVQPPMVGVDARQLRWRVWEAGVPVFVLCREPTTREGLCPIVGVGERVVRVRLDEPEQTDASWFAEAGEALGDRAIVDAEAAGEADDPPAWRVDDLLDRIEAAPDHEKLIQALARACKDAIGTTTPADRRRRRGFDDPRSF